MIYDYIFWIKGVEGWMIEWLVGVATGIIR